MFTVAECLALHFSIGTQRIPEKYVEFLPNKQRLVPIEILDLIAAESESTYRAMLAIPQFAKSITPSRRIDFMIHFGHSVEIGSNYVAWTRHNVPHKLDGPAVEWYTDYKYGWLKSGIPMMRNNNKPNAVEMQTRAGKCSCKNYKFSVLFDNPHCSIEILMVRSHVDSGWTRKFTIPLCNYGCATTSEIERHYKKLLTTAPSAISLFANGN